MPPQNNTYGPMTTPGQPSKANPLAKLTGGGNPMIKRLATVVGGVIVLIIIVLIFSSIVSNAGKGNITAISDVALDQLELTNISQQAGNKAINQLVKNLAATTQATMDSSEAQLLNSVKSTGTTLTALQSTKDDPGITSQLTSASDSGTFDTVFVQIEQNQLSLYATDLQLAFKATSNSSLKTLLSGFYKQAQLLETEASSAAQNLS